MNNYKPGSALALLSVFLWTQNAHCEEALWLFAKGSDTRPKGSYEIKSSDLVRTGKAGADYEHHDMRLEGEYGLTSKWTIGAKAIVYRHDYQLTNPNANIAANSNFKSTQFAGYDLSLKYNVLSPYKDAFGLSFGLGYENRQRSRLDGSKIDQDSISVAVFAQKTFLDDTVVMAFSPKVNYQRKDTFGGPQQELILDVAAGVAYRLSPGWFAGLEFRHQSSYLNPYQNGAFDPDLQTTNISLSDFDFSVGSQNQRGNYFGPTIHYATQGWWATLGALYQIEGQGINSEFSNIDGRNLSEQERWHIGLILGWEFGRDNGSSDFDLSDFEF